MAVIKATNVTVNWYKSTKMIEIQGVNEQSVKQHCEHLILSASLDNRQVSVDGGTKTVKAYNHDASDLQGDDESGFTVADKSVMLTIPSLPISDAPTGSLISDSLVVNDEINAHLIPDSQSLLIHVPKLAVRLPLADDKPGRCHGCASLDAKLHQLRDHFQSEIDSLKERFQAAQLT